MNSLRQRRASSRRSSSSIDSKRRSPVPGTLVDPVEDQSVDRLLAEVPGDLGPRVVGPELLLVDVLLEDVAQDVRVDLVVLAARRVVQVPGVVLEEVEDAREGGVRDLQIRMIGLDPMLQEEPAVEVADLSQQAPSLGAALGGRAGEALEEEELQEVAVVEVRPRSSGSRRACGADSSDPRRPGSPSSGGSRRTSAG